MCCRSNNVCLSSASSPTALNEYTTRKCTKQYNKETVGLHSFLSVSLQPHSLTSPPHLVQATRIKWRKQAIKQELDTDWKITTCEAQLNYLKNLRRAKIKAASKLTTKIDELTTDSETNVISPNGGDNKLDVIDAEIEVLNLKVTQSERIYRELSVATEDNSAETFDEATWPN